MKLAPLLAVVAACTPTNTVGETVVSVEALDFGTTGRAGPSDHLVRGYGALEVRDPGGELLWQAVCEGVCPSSAIDRDGNVYSFVAANSAGRLVKRAADGQVAWSLPCSFDAAAVVVDDANIVWLLTNARPAYIDGAPLPTGPNTSFARITDDGMIVSTGRLEVGNSTFSVPLAIPGGGIAVRRELGYVCAVNDDGSTRWCNDSPSSDVAFHANGDVTIAERSLDAEPTGQLARYDSSHVEQWRVQLPGLVYLTAVRGGVVAVGSAGLGERDVSTLVFYNEEGDPSPREVIEAKIDIVLFSGPESDGFWFFQHGDGGGEGTLIRRHLD